MNMEENDILLNNFIKSNPFDFKQGIISYCRKMDKLDVYEWVAEDELKIKNLTNRNKELEDGFKASTEELCEYAKKNSVLNDQLDRELIKRARLEDKIKKITKIIDSYNLGKYDYSIPQAGIIELQEILEGKK